MLIETPFYAHWVSQPVNDKIFVSIQDGYATINRISLRNKDVFAKDSFDKSSIFFTNYISFLL